MTFNAKLSTFFFGPRMRRDRPAWVGFANRWAQPTPAQILKRLDRLRRIGPTAITSPNWELAPTTRAIVSGSILEDEKVLGTVHIALGGDGRHGKRTRTGVPGPGRAPRARVAASVWKDPTPGDIVWVGFKYPRVGMGKSKKSAIDAGKCSEVLFCWEEASFNFRESGSGNRGSREALRSSENRPAPGLFIF